jgi:hypothetical protein
MTDFAVVVPTIGRKSFHRLLDELSGSAGPRPSAVIVVDALADAGPPLLSATRLPVTVVRSGGRGPACPQYGLARRPDPLDLLSRRRRDPAAEPVRRPGRRRRGGRLAGRHRGARHPWPARHRRRPAHPALAGAKWITADMAYRRSAPVAVGRFDERFPFPHREDSDLALRITLASNTIAQGTRRSSHPVAAATPRRGTVSGLPSGCGRASPAAERRSQRRDGGRVGRGRSPGAICSLVSG